MEERNTELEQEWEDLDCVHPVRETQPNPQEWTEDRVEQCLSNHGAKGLAESINAALAAKQEYIDEIRTTTYSDLEQQLADEQKDRRADKFSNLLEIGQLREQLAAEREKVETGDAMVRGLNRKALEYREKVHRCEVIHRHRETIELLKDRVKTLVDAVEKAASACVGLDAWRAHTILTDALAKVKGDK